LGLGQHTEVEIRGVGMTGAAALAFTALAFAALTFTGLTFTALAAFMSMGTAAIAVLVIGRRIGLLGGRGTRSIPRTIATAIATAIAIAPALTRCQRGCRATQHQGSGSNGRGDGLVS